MGLFLSYSSCIKMFIDCFREGQMRSPAALTRGWCATVKERNLNWVCPFRWISLKAIVENRISRDSGQEGVASEGFHGQIRIEDKTRQRWQLQRKEKGAKIFREEPKEAWRIAVTKAEAVEAGVGPWCLLSRGASSKSCRSSHPPLPDFLQS